MYEDELDVDDDEEYDKQRTYTNPDCVQFVEDMEEAGFEVTHYRGRYSWEGPAVSVDHYSEAFAATSVRCQMDNLGLGFIVYPESPDSRWH